MKKTFFAFKSFRAKMTFFFVLAMIFLATLSDFIIYRYALHSQFNQLRDKLMTIAQIAAVGVDVPTLLEVPLTKEGINATQYSAVVEKLVKIKNSIPSIKYLYILTKTEKPGILKFMLDVSNSKNKNEGPETYPGDEYDASRFPEMLKGFVAPAADKALAADQWGVFLSGYAPIRDKAGNPVAILGVDMKAQDVYDVQKEVRHRAIVVFLLGVTLALLLGAFISGGVSRQIAELLKGAQRIAKGDLDSQVMVKGTDEIARLAHFFNQMSAELKIYIAELNRTTTEKERLLKELEIARHIQQSFLPDHAPKIEGIEITAISLPARMVGGDFYDFIPIEKDKWGVVIADVSGKGVPAALFMALSRTLMRSSAAITLSPSEALAHTNKLIFEDTKTDMFVTLFYAVLDAGARILRYANAGHNPPFIINGASSDIVLLKAQSAPLGVMPQIKASTEEIILKKDDIIVLYTDGVTDAINAQGGRFGVEQLEKVVRTHYTLGAEAMLAKIQEELALFVGEQAQFDDITMMVIKAV